MKKTLILSLAAASVAAHAGYAVVPNANATTPVSSSGFSVLTNNASRVGQLLIGQNQLGSVAVGTQITGLSFRLYSGATAAGPSKDTTWSDYSISVGQSLAPLDADPDGDLSSTLADNFVGAPQLVRSGALTIAKGSLTATGVKTQANNWFEIAFQTPYTYTGGNLGIQISHSGNDANTSLLLEVASPATAGYQAGDYAFYYQSPGDGVASKDAFFTTRLTTAAPVPEPATLAALGLGALALVRRRRQSR